MEKYLIIYGKPRFLGYLSFEGEEPLERGTHIHAQTDRGEELVVVIGKAQEDISCPKEREKKHTPRKDAGQNHLQENTVQNVDFIGHASEELLEERASLGEDEAEILSTARKILRKHDLAMKLVDAEFLLGKKKLFLYFTSEDRVDFRSYVRDLAREFKTRIELRQIGIRDEARVVGGLASCGRQCCCSYWLHQFAPICIRMVKEQNLALNPTKISGICGRLMCCMSYEHFMYKDLWDQLPNPGTKIRGPESTYILSGVDIASQSVRIFGMGKEIVIPVDKYAEFCAVIQEGKAWESDSPPPSRKNPRTLSAPVEMEKPRKASRDPQENAERKSAEAPPESASASLKKDQPKKKLQRRKRSPQGKSLGTGSAPDKKEEPSSQEKQKTSGEPRKNRGSRRKRGTPVVVLPEGAAAKKRPPNLSSSESSKALSSGSGEEKKASPENRGREKTSESKPVPFSEKREGERVASQRKRRRRPRKSSPQTGDSKDAPGQNKPPRGKNPQEK